MLMGSAATVKAAEPGTSSAIVTFSTNAAVEPIRQGGSLIEIPFTTTVKSGLGGATGSLDPEFV